MKIVSGQMKKIVYLTCKGRGKADVLARDIILKGQKIKSAQDASPDTS